ncbi:MAG: demethylmenaquinone methyltransferase [Kyrpidia tusciae]|nr:demethylmenaquinone methyltransferase [Kyrpidia tusciae]MBE3551261.1 demethylmenaquinone methyltransferase [Kyrpidia tusciae]
MPNQSNQQPSKVELVQSIFSRIARYYDRMNDLISFQRHKAWRAFTMKQMAVFPGAQVLDVAAGTGDWTVALAKAAGAEGRVVGLDFCREMLDVAKEKVSREGVGRQTSLVLGDAMELPYSENTFDFATIGFALRNVKDYRQVLREMTRVVKPGGLVVSLELSKPTWEPFRTVYYFYFYKVMPFVARLLVGEGAPAYQYLPNSLTHFPGAEELAQVFREVGLEEVRFWRFSGGVAALHIGRKPKGVASEADAAPSRAADVEK